MEKMKTTVKRGLVLRWALALGWGHLGGPRVTPMGIGFGIRGIGVFGIQGIVFGISRTGGFGGHCGDGGGKRALGSGELGHSHRGLTMVIGFGIGGVAFGIGRTVFGIQGIGGFGVSLW